MVVATAIAPAAVAPAVAGCCGAYGVSGTMTISENGTGSYTSTTQGGETYSSSGTANIENVAATPLNTTNAVTNTSMQMTVSEDAVFVPSEYAPDLSSENPTNCSSSEVM
jgi:hypothetical protein